jgi:ABC-type lipoprotein release transport system permease subunit
MVLSRVPVAYNIRNLIVRWKTTVLSALTFTLVVSLLIVMLAFVRGLERLTERSGQPGNVIVLSASVTDELVSYLSVSDTAEIGLQPGVSRDEEGRPLCSREVFTVIRQSNEISEEGGTQHFYQVRGVEEPALAARIHGLNLYPGGEWFSEAGVREFPSQAGARSATTALEAVLGEGVARELGVNVGDTFELGPRQWLAAGILESAGSMFASEIWAKRQVVSQLARTDDAYNSISLRTADAASARQLARELTTRFKKAGLWAMPETEYYTKLSDMNRRFLGASWLVAVFLAIGGSFGLMNTMFAAVHSRAKDIGILRVLGYTRAQILMSFLLEALVLAAAGGLAGCAVGLLVDGWTASSTISGDQWFNKNVLVKLEVDPSTIALGLWFSMIMGTLGGLVPALSTTLIRPLQSLR